MVAGAVWSGDWCDGSADDVFIRCLGGVGGGMHSAGRDQRDAGHPTEQADQ
ncbi:hypothetical protein [Streptomyces sp. AC1-42T]|uniref:hypothetical protein n=1 Tax=Streptomyces sp. AC1-42T TaxID=2218665 RepID=UPI0018F78C2D|nr:hypothetical protein [Streptomyces sp. AC1-42T]